MARKSRTAETPVETSGVFVGKTVYRTALYARLSHEREDTVERDTIGNQVAFLRSYAERHDELTICDVYVDDSVSGTTMERPGFERLMADIRCGRIEAVVVKDLSRMARDYIELGNLMERVFPMMNVRFIAVNDNYDSAKTGMNLSVPVTNIANTLYALDISKKIKAVKERNKRDGIPLSSVPYGYKTEYREKKRVMAEDKEAADVVRRIFALYLSGKKKMEIAKILNVEKVPTPYQYRNAHRQELLDGKPHLAWTLNNIDRILNNEVYTGKYVIGKHTSDLSRNIKWERVDEKDWLVFEDHHPAIISKEDFEKAKTLKREDGRKKSGHENILKGKIFCGVCGDSFSNFSGGGHYYYQCTRKRRYGHTACESVTIGEDWVCGLILGTLKDEIALFADHDAVIGHLLKSTPVRRQRKVYEDALRKNREASDAVAEKKSRLYRDLKDGIVDMELFGTLQDEYTKRLRELEEKGEELTGYLDGISAGPADSGEWKEKISGYLRKRKLTKEAVDVLIEKVTVYGDKRVEIRFTFDDVLKRMAETRGNLEAVHE